MILDLQIELVAMTLLIIMSPDFEGATILIFESQHALSRS